MNNEKMLPFRCHGGHQTLENPVIAGFFGPLKLFVLEDLSFLERNGRLTGVKRLAANLLHIVPIMGSTPEGTIYQVDQTRGFKKAMSRLVDIIVGECEKKQPKDLVIAHCNCPERAEDLKEKILTRYSDINININDTKGVASLYAGNKGIIVAL